MEIANLLSSIFWILVELGSLFVCMASLAGFLGRRSWLLDLFSHFRFQYLVLLAFATIVFVAGGRYPQAVASGLFAFVNMLLVAPLYIKGTVHESSNPGRTGQDAYRVLLANVNRVMTRSRLYESVWNAEYDGLSNVLDVYVNYLRNKLERGGRSRVIHTVRGRGYLFGKPPDD